MFIMLSEEKKKNNQACKHRRQNVLIQLLECCVDVSIRQGFLVCLEKESVSIII